MKPQRLSNESMERANSYSVTETDRISFEFFLERARDIKGLLFACLTLLTVNLIKIILSLDMQLTALDAFAFLYT